jgi:hypothetical protein
MTRKPEVSDLLIFIHKYFPIGLLVCLLLLFLNCCKQLYSTDPVTTVETITEEKHYQAEPDSTGEIYSQWAENEVKHDTVDMSAGPVDLSLDVSLEHTPEKSTMKINSADVKVKSEKQIITHEKKTVVEISIYRTLFKISATIAIAAIVGIGVLIYTHKVRR